MKIILTETNPILLNNEWEESDGKNGWASKSATIKIFSNEEEYKNYKNAGPI